MNCAPLLDIQGLRVGFQRGLVIPEVVHGIDLRVGRGEAVGLVGESGSGKSVAALSVLRLLGPHGHVTGGRIAFEGTDLAQLKEADMRRVRGKEISMIFQDPTTALNPAFSIGTQLTDVIKAHRALNAASIRKEALEALDLVGFPDPVQVMRSYPHELSGGMRQRAMIAMAIACKPRLVLADEPTTALDVTVQAQIVELLRSLIRELGIGLVFITHNLDLMAELCDRAVVLYQGRVMESGPTVDIVENPAHPYTRLLFDSIARIDGPSVRRDVSRAWQDPAGAGNGCIFSPRCSQSTTQCKTLAPPARGVGERRAACWYAEEADK